MYTVDPVWRYYQQMFLNAVEGQDVKECLIDCLLNCYLSHLENVKRKNDKYREIIEWDPITGPPPRGWYIDPNDRTWKKAENSEVNNG